MSTVVGGTYQYPVRVPKKESTIMSLHFTVDTSAAIVVANTVSCDPGFTVTKGATGRYDVVYPLCPADAVVTVQPHFTGTFPTAGQFVRVSAKSTTAGTLSITTSTTYGAVAADLNQAVEFDIVIMAANRSGN